MSGQSATAAVPARYWAFSAMCAVASHVLLSVALPTKVWTTSLGVGASLSLALIFCMVRAVSAERLLRRRWTLLGIAFGLWIGAYVAIAYIQLAGGDASEAHVDALLYTLRAVPILLLLSQSWGEERRPSVRVADGLQVALFALLLCILLSAVIWPLSGEPPMTDTTALLYHDVQNFGLALLSLASLVCNKSFEQRRFGQSVATLLLLYAVSAWLVNHLSLSAVPPPPPGSVINVAADVPIVAFILVAVRSVPLLKPFPDNRLRLLVSLVVPAAVCAASILTAIAIGAYHQLPAVLGGGCALALFVYRSAVAQAGLVEARRDLLSTSDALRELANIDALTDLPNRRHFDDRLLAEWRRLSRSSGRLAISMIDVDHFKLYNDSRGHLAGDLCLRSVADLMRACARRDGDCLARYGGEEFALIAPVADETEALRSAEAIRSAIEEAKIQHPVADLGNLTVSIGVAVAVATSDGDPRALLARADRALYHAKKAGRNRTEVAAAAG